MTRRNFIKRAGLWVPVAATLALPRRVSAALPVSDAFTDTDGVALATHNASWTVITGAFDITSNSVRSTQQVTALARWTGETFADNQYAQGVMGALTDWGLIGLSVRVATDGSTTAYVVEWRSNYVRLRKLVAGTGTDLATTTTVPATGSVIRLEANGTTIRALDDGVEILTATDSDITSGVAGISGWFDGSAGGNLLASWEAGNLSAGGTRRRVVVTQ